MRPISKEAWVALVIILVGGMVLRVAYIDKVYVADPFKADAGEYRAYADNLRLNGVFSKSSQMPPPPDSFRSPGYPLFLLGVHAAVGEDDFYDIVLRVQAVLGALAAALSFFLARRFLPDYLALVAAGITATSPHLVVMTGYILTETLFTFLLLASLLVFLRAVEWERKYGLGAAGFAFGVTYLVNETASLLVVALSLGILLFYGKPGRLKAAGLLFGVFLVFPVAWKARDAIVVPDGAPRGGQRALATMAHGTYVDFTHEDPTFQYYPYREDPRYAELSGSFAGFRKVFLERAGKDPNRYLRWYFLEKPVHLFGWSYLQGTGDIYIYKTQDSPLESHPVLSALKALHRFLHPLLVVLALLALPVWLFRIRRDAFAESPGPFLIVVLTYVAIAVVFAPWPRYALPLKPLLFGLAMWIPALIFKGVEGARTRVGN